MTPVLRRVTITPHFHVFDLSTVTISFALHALIAMIRYSPADDHQAEKSDLLNERYDKLSNQASWRERRPRIATHTVGFNLQH